MLPTVTCVFLYTSLFDWLNMIIRFNMLNSEFRRCWSLILLPTKGKMVVCGLPVVV